LLSHNNIISVPLAKLHHHLDTMANIKDTNCTETDTNNTNQVQNDIIYNNCPLSRSQALGVWISSRSRKDRCPL